MVATSNNDQVKQITKDVTASSSWTRVIDQAEQQIQKDEAQIGVEEKTLSDAQDRLGQLKKAWEDDTICVNGNRAANGDLCGPGPESNALKQAWETYRDNTFPPIQENHDKNVATLRDEIKNIGNGKHHVFAIQPTSGTIVADIVALIIDEVVGDILGNAVEAVATDVFRDNVFKAAAASSCTKMLGDASNGFPSQSVVTNLLLGHGLECIKDLLIIMGRAEVQRGSGMDIAKVGKLSDAITKLRGVIANKGWANLVYKLGDVVDFIVDRNGAVRELEFGFSILSKYTYTEPPSQPTPTTPPPPAPPVNPPSATAPPPPPPVTPPPVTAPPTQDPPDPVRVLAYDNYGPVTTAGTAMCAGNPQRPESMPTGTVEQTFTISGGIAHLDTATVQIDHNASMTVHAVLLVNGEPKATNDQTPIGDTIFTFNRVPVRPGNTVTLKLTWSGTAGKLDTIYTTGNPPNSHLRISNTCSDYGSPHNMDTTTTGLRATIGGWTA